MDKWIEIFKAGTWTDAKGKVHSYSQGDLDSIVATNDPSKRLDARKVPLVIGHPKHTDPAWGWVDGLKREGDILFMKAKDVVPEFAQAVNDGRYRKVSICVNPTTKELDHVGFLGAVQPAVPGLADAQFAAPTEESAVFEYSAWSGDGLIARLFQNLRDHLVETIGLEKADGIISQWDIDSLKQQATLEDAAVAPASGYSKTAVPAIPPAPSAEETRLKEENTRLLAQIAASEEEKRAAENDAFCKSLVDSGQLLPAQREDALKLLNSTTAPELAAFSKEGTLGAGPLLKAFLSKLPKQIKLDGEIATHGAEPSANDATALAERASAYMAEMAGKGIVITSADAVNHLLSQGAKR